MPTFIPPTVEEGPAGGGPLFGRYKLTKGVSVLVENGGAVRLVRYPSLDEILAAEAHYLGGNEYQITAAEAAILQAGGLGDYIS